MLPLVKDNDYSFPVECIKKFFKEKNQKIKFRGIPEEYLDKFRSFLDFPYELQTNQHENDYLYDADIFRYYKGKKLHKKRNNYNRFVKEYQDRYEFRQIDKKDYYQIYEFLHKWTETKVVDDSIKNEVFGTKKLLCHYGSLDFVMGGVYIDGILEGFSIANLLNKDYVIIQVEKANPNIRGLYQYLAQEMILQEFPDVLYVNRQEDLGVPGLIKSKQSYRPSDFGVKYSITEVD